jgi:adenine-specific DNA-methyltransferase
MPKKFVISSDFSATNDLTLKHGDCLEFLKTLPPGCAQLVVTSPPYNVGKEYEQRQDLQDYLDFQRKVIVECERIVRTGGSICWQIGNQFDNRGRLIPLDAVLYPIFCQHATLHLRNRIVWHYGHGLHCRARFSGRYETILWFSKGEDYVFNLDSVRVPQKYPGKRAYQGANRGLPSGNPKGKNPGDVWHIPNVVANHVEKTKHPCQFPIALVETLILALTNRRHLVVDPYLGAGTTAVAALKNSRRAAGADIKAKYLRITRERVDRVAQDTLAYRPRWKPIHEPTPNTKLTTPPNGFHFNGQHS